MIDEVVPGAVAVVRDTCNVYALRSGRNALLVDVGSGAVFDRLAELGIDRITDVLVTHHHRDQVQGLERARAAGARIRVPPSERGLLGRPPRTTWNDYDLREDRFSLLEPVHGLDLAGEYRTESVGGFEVYTLPTPGHTLGSVTYLIEVAGSLLAFTGDLVYGDGQVWSPAALQWTYSGVEGWAATIVSCHTLAGRNPEALLPSHGGAVADPQAALATLAGRMQELIDLRLPTEWDVAERIRQPFAPVTAHLLRNRTMFANSYALVSDKGAALLIDFGYDVTCTASSTEREARRTLLWSLDALRRDHGVDRIEAAIVTHFHDDHVAGLNLLREIEGVEVWAPANVAPILESPERYDLPCLWFDPVPVDRIVALESPVSWQEYELTAYALPGHTRFAAAIGFEVDGKCVLATGDQQTSEADGRAILNYQYRNRFSPEDFVRSAALYRRLRPDVIVSGHWLPVDVTDDYLGALMADGQRLAELHEELLPSGGFGTDGFAARIDPFRAEVVAGEGLSLDVEIVVAPAHVRLVVPAGWTVEPESITLDEPGRACFTVTATASGRVLADVSPFGQQAEAHICVR
jgi:glyoxylase-like metal-dependent hydrolase (beta-lactamase superfamily II)